MAGRALVLWGRRPVCGARRFGLWGAATWFVGHVGPFVGCGFLDAPCTVPVRGARRLGAPSPCVGAASGRPGRTRSHLAGGGVPPGGKTISFSAEKETVLHPKEKEGPGLRLVCGRTRRPASLRTVWGPLPAVTAITPRNRDNLWFYPGAACSCLSQGRVRQCPAWGAALCFVGRDDPARHPPCVGAASGRPPPSRRKKGGLGPPFFYGVHTNPLKRAGCKSQCRRSCWR